MQRIKWIARLWVKPQTMPQKIFFILIIIIPLSIFGQSNFNLLPDTIIPPVKYEKVVEQILADEPPVFYRIPVPEFGLRKNQRVLFYQDIPDCDTCQYIIYIDSITIQEGYYLYTQEHSLLRQKEKHISKVAKMGWVKKKKTLPKKHRPCIGPLGVDTCLWKFVPIEEPEFKMVNQEIRAAVLDSVFVPPVKIPVEVRKLKHPVHYYKNNFIIKEKTKHYNTLYVLPRPKPRRDQFLGTYRTKTLLVPRITKEVTPLNYFEVFPKKE